MRFFSTFRFLCRCLAALTPHSHWHGRHTHTRAARHLALALLTVNAIGPASAQAIGKGLEVNGSLTLLTLYGAFFSIFRFLCHCLAALAPHSH